MRPLIRASMTGVAAVLVGLLVMFCPGAWPWRSASGSAGCSGPAARSSRPRMWSWSVSMAPPASVWASLPGCAVAAPGLCGADRAPGGGGCCGDRVRSAPRSGARRGQRRRPGAGDPRRRARRPVRVPRAQNRPMPGRGRARGMFTTEQVHSPSRRSPKPTSGRFPAQGAGAREPVLGVSAGRRADASVSRSSSMPRRSMKIGGPCCTRPGIPMPIERRPISPGRPIPTSCAAI